MIPHMLVLKPGLVVHRIYNGYWLYWLWGRPSVVEPWHDLRDLMTRPDCDLSKPGLREGLERRRLLLPRPGTRGRRPAGRRSNGSVRRQLNTRRIN
jgi:hypothetical protein